MARTVFKIPKAGVQSSTDAPKARPKKRVAAYARVSTLLEEQASSYQTQVNFYNEYINSREDWEMVKVYADEGISATNTKRREGFKEMVHDALNGKIDLIITKSISRFARNTVDSLQTIRQLKEKGVEVYFEKENIWTLDSKGEVLLTIMSSLAQEESRSISENVKWATRKRFAEGKASVAYSRFLGYDKDFKINEAEAATVRKIFGWFLQGHSYIGISRMLNDGNYPTASGKGKWNDSTVKRILTNEKYKGDALLQKTYSVDFLTKKSVINTGEVQQYYVTEHHDPIIDPEVFDRVQVEIANRTQRTRGYAFSGKLICGECGERYTHKTWHSTDKYKKTIWQCKGKFKTKHSTSFLTEAEVEQAFVSAVNELISRKDDLLPTLNNVVKSGLGIDELEEQVQTTTDRQKTIESQLTDLVDETTQSPLTVRTIETLSEEYGRLDHEFGELTKEISKRQSRLYRIQEYCENLTSAKVFDAYDEDKFRNMVDSITVLANKELCFKFMDGSEVTVKV